MRHSSIIRFQRHEARGRICRFCSSLSSPPLLRLGWGSGLTVAHCILLIFIFHSLHVFSYSTADPFPSRWCHRQCLPTSTCMILFQSMICQSIQYDRVWQYGSMAVWQYGSVAENSVWQSIRYGRVYYTNTEYSCLI